MLYNPQWQTQNLTGWRKVLWDAADHLDAHGWCQGRLSNANNERCLIGVLVHQCIHVGTPPDVMNAATIKIREAISPIPIPFWNDHPQRTKAEVTGLLRRLATE